MADCSLPPPAPTPPTPKSPNGVTGHDQWLDAPLHGGSDRVVTCLCSAVLAHWGERRFWCWCEWSQAWSKVWSKVDALVRVSLPCLPAELSLSAALGVVKRWVWSKVAALGVARRPRSLCPTPRRCRFHSLGAATG